MPYDDSYEMPYSTSSEISKRALYFAGKYVQANTKYAWGGQDSLGKSIISMDCSGLIVRCYSYAVSEEDRYVLFFDDTTVLELYNSYTIKIENPVPGDLIFMGEPDNNDTPTHISIYVETIGDNIYFIDATQKEEESGNPAIDGVTKRFYHKDDNPSTKL